MKRSIEGMILEVIGYGLLEVIGYGLLVVYGGWRIALGVFFIEWAITLAKQDKES